ncbi:MULTISPECIES: phage tail spike protein [Anaerostipes]|uniref:phage tail spike protein n=1 Tax=Anaerostipes TaxID=207244 RepID=UPI00204965B8|nr:MAG TPA: baseplate protein [Caudoviricetes sp.]
MYKVKLNDKYIYHPWDKDLQICDPKLDTELNKNGSFSFVIYPDNPLYNQLEKLKSKVHILWFDSAGNEKEIFRGRVLSEETDFDGEKTVTCEGDLAFLLDTIQRPYSSTVSPADRFKQLINAHNSQVEPDKQFQIGNITMTGDSVKVTENSYPDTRTDIENKLLNVYGGYIRTREQDGKYYIDYLKEYDDKEGQAVRYGENILDITKYIKADDIKTCIIPLGATNSATGKAITIESVNNGVDYLYDQSAVDTFGKIYGTVSFSDVESPNTLKQKGQEQVEALKNLIVSIELTAVDLKDLGYDVKEIAVGDFIPVVSLPHGINSYMQVSKKSQNLKKPEDSSIVLGSTIKTLVENQSVYNSGIQNVIPAVNNAVNTANNAANTAEQVKVEMDAVTNKIYPVGSIYISVNNANPASFFGGSWTAFATGRTLVGVDTGQSEFNSVEKPGGHKELQSHTHGLNNHVHSLNNHTHSVPNHVHTMQGAGNHYHYLGINKDAVQKGTSYNKPNNFESGSTSYKSNTTGNHTHTMNSSGTCTTGGNSGNTGGNSGNTTSAGGGNAGNLQPYITVYMWKRIG